MDLGDVFQKAEAPESQQRGPGGASEDDPRVAPPPTEKATQDPKTLYWDPFSIIEQLGYKDRPSNVTYGTLRAIRYKVPIVQAVIDTRVSQVATFAAKPSYDRYDMGFQFHRRGDPKAELSPAERRWAEQMNTVMLRTGVTDNPRGRPSFETFAKQFMLDSLTFDQACMEVVPNRLGQPAEWYAVDGSSIRLADSASAYLNEDDKNATRYVQIYDGMIITEYTQEELCFGIRNPTTDMRLYGYGTSELEKLMNVMTSLLWSWEYNQRAFSQGSSQKGILNFKGPVPDNQLKAFRRHWYQMMSGVENAWRTPITNADELQWIAMHMSNKDMEYSDWFDFLIKVTCAMYAMDPIEVNFKYGNTGQTQSMQDTHNKDKITESRERGLRPLLRFFADCLNRHVIWPINENMELAFVGLDALTRDEATKINKSKVETSHTVNEIRAEDNLDPIEGGDVILNPVFAQMRQAAVAEAQAEQDAEPGGGGEDDADFKKLLAENSDDETDNEADEQNADEDVARKSRRPRHRVRVAVQV